MLRLLAAPALILSLIFAALSPAAEDQRHALRDRGDIGIAHQGPLDGGNRVLPQLWLRHPGAEHAGDRYPFFITLLGAIALFASTTNIVSGFLLTDRMLKMFQKTQAPKKTA